MEENSRLISGDEESLTKMEESSRLIPGDEESLEGVMLEDPATFDGNSEKIDKKLNALRGLSHYTIFSIGIAKHILLFILPSFISSHWTNAGKVGDSNELRPTAFLDGVRGLAAWAVFNSHIADTYIDHAKASWGQVGDHRSPFQLPIFRLCFKGDFAVALFFVISGFALSIAPVTAMRKNPRNPGTAMAKLSSAVFRRAMRLMIPSWASTFIVFLLIRFNYFGGLQASMPRIEELVPNGLIKLGHWPDRKLSFFRQLYGLTVADTDMLRIFDAPRGNAVHTSYNGVLWSIKIEYQASLILYLTHAALFPMRKKHRIACTVGLIIFGLSLRAISLPLFWSGYLIAEFSQLSLNEDSVVPMGQRRILMSAISWIAFIFGLWCGSLPGWKPENIPWYAWMDEITPNTLGRSSRVWTAVGAVLVVWSLRKIPLLLKVYCSRPIQYLGKISFSLYVVHFWIVTGLGTFIVYTAWSITGKESILKTCAGFGFAYSLILGLVIWVADLFWRCIDIPSVLLAKRLEAWLFQES